MASSGQGVVKCKTQGLFAYSPLLPIQPARFYLLYGKDDEMCSYVGDLPEEQG
jgi:hypothetical protein